MAHGLRGELWKYLHRQRRAGQGRQWRECLRGSAGEGGTTETADSEEAPLPENAELLEALGILDVVTAYDLTVLSGLDIPIELLPPPPADAAPAAPSDIDTGGAGTVGCDVR